MTKGSLLNYIPILYSKSEENKKTVSCGKRLEPYTPFDFQIIA